MRTAGIMRTRKCELLAKIKTVVIFAARSYASAAYVVMRCSGAGRNSKVEGHKLPALCGGRKIFDVPLHFSVVPLQVGGHNKNRVGTANSFH